MKHLNSLCILAASLILLPSQSLAFADENKAEGRCSFVITGKVAGDIDVNCSEIPKHVIDKLIANTE